MVLVCLICSFRMTKQTSRKNPRTPLTLYILRPPLIPLLSLSLSLSFYSFTVTPCVPIFFPYVSRPPFTTSIPVSSSQTPLEAILCHFVPFLLHFLPTCPLLLHYNQTLSRFPQIPSATPALSPSFSICLSPSRFFSPSPLPSPSLSVLLTCST